jgi:hypothetical protein
VFAVIPPLVAQGLADAIDQVGARLAEQGLVQQAKTVQQSKDVVVEQIASAADSISEFVQVRAGVGCHCLVRGARARPLSCAGAAMVIKDLRLGGMAPTECTADRVPACADKLIGSQLHCSLPLQC